MKKRLRDTVIFIILLLLGMGQPGWFELQAAAEDAVKIDMKMGFDRFYKIEYITPVFFEIENNLRDINGELQIEMPNQSGNITVYAMNVSLPKDSVKKFVMNVPVYVFNTKLNVNITEGKNTVVSKTFRVDPGASAESFAIGILSDDFESVKYINKITLKNVENFGTKNVRLDEASFPENYEALDTFDVIIINSFDTSKLSKAQYEALKKWVHNGGVLVIGTGVSGSKTLAAFKDDFITGEVGEVKTVRTGSLHKMAESKAVDMLSINALDIKVKEGRAVIEDGDNILLQKIDRGKGVVAIAAFDFGMEPLSTWVGNSTFADKAITAVLPQSYIKNIHLREKMGYRNFYAIDNALRSIPELPVPKTSHMILLYAAYILLAAPVNYFILKRMDRRELMWITVPVLSILFTGIVFISGAGTRVTEPVTNVISLVDIDNSGTIVPKTYAGVFTPQKNSVRIEAEENTIISPLRLNNNYYRITGDNDEGKKIIESKVTLSPHMVLEYYKTGVWSMKTLAMESEEVLTGKLESDINYAKGAFTGTIKNTSGFDLEECYIVMPGQYAEIGPVKNGETKKIDAKTHNYFGQGYDLINAIYNDSYSGPLTRNRRRDFTPEEIMKLRLQNQKRQVMEFALMNEAGPGFEAKLIGWSSTHAAGDLLVNGKSTKKYEKSLITAKADLSFIDGNSIEYPMGFLKPEIVNIQDGADYDEYGGSFFGRGSFEVHYKIDDNIKLESVRTQYSMGDKLRVKQYIWDNIKGDWAEGDYSSFFIYDGMLDRYIDGSNILKLKFEIDDDGLELPRISVKGSVR